MHQLLLKNFSRHISLTSEEIRKLPQYFVHKKIRKHQFLLQEGNVCRADYFVIKGSLRQYESDNAGREHVIQFALEDWWISDLNSLVTGTPSIYSIDAMEDSEVLELNISRQEKLFTDIPKMNVYWRIIMQKAFVAQQRRVLFLHKPLEQRYEDFLQRYSDFEQRIPQHQIASFLGITRESMSRIRRVRKNSHI
ncbi:MAG: Crp/Fnr family transcriptional regulator [Chitinophagaceae bacterium]|nr:Crp/Fnr family transcriptional regulator [Chitinophagaceae bacterium]